MGSDEKNCIEYTGITKIKIWSAYFNNVETIIHTLHCKY